MSRFLFDYSGDHWLFTFFKVSGMVNILQNIFLGLNEYLGHRPIPYSKFANPNKQKPSKVPSKIGMLITYGPSGLFSLGFLAFKLGYFSAPAVFEGPIPRDSKIEETSIRLWIMTAAVILHFAKRVLEVLFVHRYSGHMDLDLSVFLGVSYIGHPFTYLLAQQASEGMLPPAVNLMWVGVLVFILGEYGNGYHHYKLSTLRKDGNQKYVVPHGGLFEVLVTPHYFCEIITFLGFALIGQTWSAFCLFIGTILLLGGRSYGTRRWYYQKVEDYPWNRYVLLPYVW